MSGYTRADNWLFDTVMPRAEPYTYKVVCAVMRQTAGWSRKSDVISISQFHEMIGAKSRTTTIKAIQDALDNGWIGREERGQGYIYWTIPSTENVPATSTENVLGSTENGLVTSTENGLVTSTENVHTKEKNKERGKGADPIRILAEHFTAETGLFASAGNWADEWETPLRSIYGRAGTVDAARALITDSVRFARDGPKRYTLKSPMSITTIAANMPPNGNGQGTLKVGSR